MSHAEATDHAHDHGDHAHMPFLAHHFDDAEQQYDSGKLGMWLFLVTEVLFFSGMFCAYALYRSNHPEIFTFSSQFLNETLGAFNTGVLLFSSLTMAWGVRCAQLSQRTGLVVCLAITLGCATLFLGVKAIEYTHKWDMGLLPAGMYESQYLPAAHHDGLPTWLVRLSIVPAIFLVGFAIWYVVALFKKDKASAEIAGPLLSTAACYFLGVFIGLAFESGAAEAHAADQHADASHVAGAVDGEHEEEEHAAEGVENEDESDIGDHEGGQSDPQKAESEDVANDAAGPSAVLVSTGGEEPFIPGSTRVEEIDQAGGAGLFFSIYYCMTGVHAVHILGGIVVLTWLLVRATKDQFNEEYFGPVDYVGLYWHLVDLIWIFLFPLMYLIT